MTVFGCEEHDAKRISTIRNLYRKIFFLYKLLLHEKNNFLYKFRIVLILFASCSSHPKTVIYQKLAHSEHPVLRKLNFELKKRLKMSKFNVLTTFYRSRRKNNPGKRFFRYFLSYICTPGFSELKTLICASND